MAVAIQAPLSILVMVMWPVVTFLIMMWSPPERGAWKAYLLGVLLLPGAQAIYITLMPNLNRHVMPGFALLVAGALTQRLPWKGLRVDGTTKFFFFMLLVSNVLRMLGNRDPLRYGTLALDAVAPQTALTFMIEDWLTLIIPLYLGLAMGARRKCTEAFTHIWVLYASFYMLLAATEVRLSPQIHTWVYGYFQHRWEQMVREGGFRPIVFMTHGLEVALFVAGSLLLAQIAKKNGWRIGSFSATPFMWLFSIMLVLCKSLGAMVCGFLGILLMRLSPKRQCGIAALVATLVLIHPLLRLADWFPTDSVVDFIEQNISEERAASLRFRFMNEDMFLEKATERLWTGWGGFGRYRIYDLFGRSLTVPDGAWVIEFSQGGIPRYLAVFGLLAWPMLKARKRLAKLSDPTQKQLLAAFAVTTAMMAIDLIPNGLFNSLAFVLAGVVLGLCNEQDERHVDARSPALQAAH